MESEQRPIITVKVNVLQRIFEKFAAEVARQEPPLTQTDAINQALAVWVMASQADLFDGEPFYIGRRVPAKKGSPRWILERLGLARPLCRLERYRATFGSDGTEEGHTPVLRLIVYNTKGEEVP